MYVKITSPGANRGSARSEKRMAQFLGACSPMMMCSDDEIANAMMKEIVW